MEIQADTVNGCYLVDNFDDDTKILNEYDFYDELHTLTHGIIGAKVGDEIYHKIYDEYGIF